MCSSSQHVLHLQVPVMHVGWLFVVLSLSDGEAETVAHTFSSLTALPALRSAIQPDHTMILRWIISKTKLVHPREPSFGTVALIIADARTIRLTQSR